MPCGSVCVPVDAAGQSCRHSSYYSPVGRYSKQSKRLRYVLVCDDCGSEMGEVLVLEYEPSPVLDLGIRRS
jgi:hypothetical protein